MISWQKLSNKIRAISESFWFPAIVVAVFSLLVFSPWFFQGKLPIPADTIIGLYHPWRDNFSATNPNGVPYKNFLITDPVRQQYPWRKLAVESWKMGEVPNWNPNTLAGVPLSANTQAAAYYPLNFLYLFLPFEIGWSLQIFLQIFLGGILMVFFLRSLKLHPLAVSLGSLAWIGSGFFVAWLESNNLAQVAIWLPLQLWTVEKIASGSKKWIYGLVLGLALTMGFLAGALQIFFYTTGLVVVYSLYRFLWTRSHKSFLYVLLGVISSAVLTFPQWKTLVVFSSQAIRSLSPTAFLEPGWFLPFNHLIQFLAPDFFGNPSTQNYFGVWNYMEMIGYIGVIPLLFVLLASFRFTKHSRFWLTLTAICFVLMTDNPAARMLFQLGLPVWSLAQPTRLMVLVDFSLAVLTAYGLHVFLHGEISKRKLVGVGFSILLILISLWSMAVDAHLVVSQQNLFLPTAIALFGLVLVVLAHKRQSKILVILLILITFIDLTRFVSKFISFSPKEYLFPKTSIISTIQEIAQDAEVRLATLDDRIMPANFSSIYHLPMVSTYDSFILARSSQLVSAIEANNSKAPIISGNRIVNLRNFSHPLFSLFGTTHVLTFGPTEDERLAFVSHEGNTYLYKFKNSLPRAFFAKSVIPSSKSESLEKMFDSNFNPRIQAVVEGFRQSANLGSGCSILESNFQSNYLSFVTECSTNGFLIVLDSYYPSWKAYVDNQETRIYPTDFAFRGVFVPQGTKKVELRYFD